jgi:hypothetical protein
MIAKINDDIQRALDDHGGQPLEVVDPDTNRAYIVIAREYYDRLKPLFEEDPMTLKEKRRLLRDAGNRAGWDNPEMDAYDRYDEARPQQP